MTGLSQYLLGADNRHYLLTVPAIICQLNGGFEDFHTGKGEIFARDFASSDHCLRSNAH